MEPTRQPTFSVHVETTAKGLEEEWIAELRSKKGGRRQFKSVVDEEVQGGIVLVLRETIMCHCRDASELLLERRSPRKTIELRATPRSMASVQGVQQRTKGGSARWLVQHPSLMASINNSARQPAACRSRLKGANELLRRKA